MKVHGQMIFRSDWPRLRAGLSSDVCRSCNGPWRRGGQVPVAEAAPSLWVNLLRSRRSCIVRIEATNRQRWGPESLQRWQPSSARYPNKILRIERGTFTDYDLAERYRAWLEAG